MTQIEFVRKLPAELPVEEVIEKAKAQGLKLRAARVQVIRREMRRTGSHLSLVTSSRRRGRPPKEKSLENAKRKLLELVFMLGINQTHELIEEARAKVAALPR